VKAISLTVPIAMFLAFAFDAEAQETYRRAKSHHGAIMSGRDPTLRWHVQLGPVAWLARHMPVT
jgi:hypothetical protein